ncbi:hypothetical protein SASPL_106790 [Salvia splendens]|uniref:Myb/SANT-like domain-containing protein n=1 Tax=Salvia splendens TaxID=180675 RepID=A0A8X8YA67_SALSN|nr:hypothetical protein SASPL_106790 [Salvia splendens]
MSQAVGGTGAGAVGSGGPSDNGFRTDYLKKCEDSIRQEFPTSDIKGTLHIVSKLTAWKTSYTSLRNILDRTGVGFSSNGDYKIDIDDDQWEHVVKVDPKAKFMRHKSWPLWETWKCIFGKDRAMGGGAENIYVVASHLRDFGGGGSHCDESNSQPPFVAVPFTDTEPPEDEHLAEHTSSGNTDRQPVVDKSAGEKPVFEKLSEVDGITTAEKYRLCNILSDKPQRLEVFMGMLVPARLGYLLALLEEG